MSKPSIIDRNKPYEIPDDISSIHHIKQISSGGEVKVFENGGSNHDIFNNYELTSNIKAKSVVTFDTSEIPHPEGIDVRDMIFIETTSNITGVVPNLFQVIHKSGGEIYVALNILETTERVEFYDKVGTKIGEFFINRRDYPTNKKIQFYWRGYQKEADYHRNTRPNSIDLQEIVSDETVDYIGGASVYYDVPVVSDYYSAQLSNDGIIRPSSRTEIISPSRNLKFKTTSEECVRMKKIFQDKGFHEVYQDAVVYEAGSIVIEGGKKYIAQARCVNKKPIESIIWKEI